MQHLRDLLKIQDSALAEDLRSSLRSMRALLRETLAMSTDADPGFSACDALLIELNSLLDENKDPGMRRPRQGDRVALSTDEAAGLPEFVTLNHPRVVATPDRLGYLRETFLSGCNLLSYLRMDDQPVSLPHNAADLWQKIQCCLLRVPATMAQDGRAQAKEMALKDGAVAVEETDNMIKIPFSHDRVPAQWIIYPGLTGTVNHPGLCLSTEAAIDRRVTQEMLRGDLHFLACVVSICLKFIEDLDAAALHHALKSVYRFGIQSLSLESQRSKYMGALLDRFHRAQLADGASDAIATLKARLDLDEAIHSLVTLPPVARDSWWGQLQQESRRTLNAAADQARQTCKVQIRPLWGPYADICTFSKDDLELDSGGIPGEVLACLRVYAKIGEEVLPGRVLFRSLR